MFKKKHDHTPKRRTLDVPYTVLYFINAHLIHCNSLITSFSDTTSKSDVKVLIPFNTTGHIVMVFGLVIYIEFE